MFDETLATQVLNGEVNDTAYTKFQVLENEMDNTITVEMDKVLSETTYEGGLIETENEKSAIIFATGNRSET